MVAGETIQLARLIFDASSKGLSLLSSLKNRHDATQQSAKERLKQRRQSLITLVQQSALSIQLGIELLLEYIHSSGEEFHNYEADDWCSLLGNASLSAGATIESHIPSLLCSLEGVIPDILRLVDESNEKVSKAKEFFRVATLLASAVFEDAEWTLDFFAIFSMASTLKLCALVLRRLPHNPDLLAMEVVNTIRQLEERKVSITNPLEDKLFAKFITKSISMIFFLVSRLADHCGSHNKGRIRGMLDNSRAVGLGTLIDWGTFLPELQKSFGQQGVTANDLDGISAIAVNSKGQLIVAEHENRRIKTVNKKGQCLLIFESPAIHDQDVIGQPVAMAVDKNDHVFVLMTRMRDYFIVKYDDKGKAVTWFEMQDWFADEPARVCGMAINSQGAIFLGEAVSGRIHIFEVLDNTLALRFSIQLKSEFSFCVNTYDELYVSLKDELHIFKRAETQSDGFRMKFERKVVRNKGSILAVTVDRYFQYVLVLTTGQRNTGPLILFLNMKSGEIKGIQRFTFPTNKNICIASGKRNLYWVTKGANAINRIATLEQAIFGAGLSA